MKHTEPKSWHMGLERALVSGENVWPGPTPTYRYFAVWPTAQGQGWLPFLRARVTGQQLFHDILCSSCISLCRMLLTCRHNFKVDSDEGRRQSKQIQNPIIPSFICQMSAWADGNWHCFPVYHQVKFDSHIVDVQVLCVCPLNEQQLIHSFQECRIRTLQ